jgi:hypothetical protein
MCWGLGEARGGCRAKQGQRCCDGGGRWGYRGRLRYEARRGNIGSWGWASGCGSLSNQRWQLAAAAGGAVDGSNGAKGER